MNRIRNNRYLIARRLVQITLLLLFMSANILGLKILQGNLSTAYVFESFYLSDPHAVLQMLFAGFVAGLDVIIGALIILAFYAIVGGRAFCSWICPVNIITDLAIVIRKKLSIKTDMIPYNRNVRYYVLGLGLVVSIFTSVAAFELINPITIIQRSLIFGLGIGVSVAVMILAFDIFVKKNGWCGSLCPLGAFYALFARINVIKVYHSVDKCTDCGICFKRCPEDQVLKDVINKKSSFIFSGECTNCGRCVEKCPDNALTFGFNKLKYK